MRGGARLLARPPEVVALTMRSRTRSPEHPLLRLQRSAGNQAVTAFVQREMWWDRAAREEKETFFFSKVAMNLPRNLYKGKTDASFDGVNVERHWEWGLLADDAAIVFQCGRQRFRFEATETGRGLFPWNILDRHGDTGGWTTDPVKKALNTIYHHWNDQQQFGAATSVVIDALRSDVEQYRRLEADFERRGAPD